MYGLGGFKLNDFKAKSAAQGAQKYIYNSLPRYLFCLGLLERKVEFIHFFKSTKAKQLVRQGIEFNSSPQTEATTFTFASVPVLLLWCSLTLVAEKKTMFVMISGNA